MGSRLLLEDLALGKDMELSNKIVGGGSTVDEDRENA